MDKDFDGWHVVKKRLDRRPTPPLFEERQIWWCSVGINVGHEQDGRGGDYRRPVLVLRKFNVIRDRAGLPKVYNLYTLRHTHATLLLQASVHPKVVSERLGHSTVGITLDIYSHVLPNMQREASEKLDAMLFGKPQEEGARASETRPSNLN